MSEPSVTATTTVHITIKGQTHELTRDEARALVKAINDAIGYKQEVAFREPQILGPRPQDEIIWPTEPKPQWPPPNKPGYPFPDIIFKLAKRSAREK